MTLVSIVTPTRLGRETELRRCHESVARQAYIGEIEHVIVADQGSPLRRQGWGDVPGVRLVELNDSWRDGRRDQPTGSLPWMVGSLLAHGELVGFLGDDDELEPDHVMRHLAALSLPGISFSVSRVRFCVAGMEQFIIGDDTFSHGHLDADGIMCRASALKAATWNPEPVGEASPAIADAGDYRLVRDWQAAGLRGYFIGGTPTATHHDGWAAR